MSIDFSKAIINSLNLIIATLPAVSMHGVDEFLFWVLENRSLVCFFRFFRLQLPSFVLPFIPGQGLYSVERKKEIGEMFKSMKHFSVPLNTLYLIVSPVFVLWASLCINWLAHRVTWFFSSVSW